MLNAAQKAFVDKFDLASGAPDAPAPDDKSGFEELLEESEKLVARARSKSPLVAKLLSKTISVVSAAVAESKKQAASGDKASAAKTLQQQAGAARALDRDIDTAVLYATEQRKFATRLSQTRHHRRTGGAIAIEEYLQRMEADEKRRQTAETRGDIRQALAACEAQDHRHTAMMMEAARGVEFTRLQTEIETEISRLESQAPGGGKAAPVIAEVREMMNDAGNFTKSDNWVGATLMLRKARTELKVGTKGLELVDKLVPEEAPKDFNKAYAQVTATITGLRKLPAARGFKRELADCVEQTRAARAALPDEAAAMQQLNSARRTCAELSTKLLEGGKYTSTVRQVMDQRKKLLRAQQDKCAQPEAVRAGRMLKEANKKAQGKDFAAAMDLLDKATGELRAGHKISQLYSRFVAPARIAIAKQLRSNSGDDPKARLTELDVAFRNRDLKASETLARTALEAAEA